MNYFHQNNYLRLVRRGEAGFTFLVGFFPPFFLRKERTQAMRFLASSEPFLGRPDILGLRGDLTVFVPDFLEGIFKKIKK